ncbi:hypothetical protein ACJX0J_025348, partial [Zea mays]
VSTCACVFTYPIMEKVTKLRASNYGKYLATQYSYIVWIYFHWMYNGYTLSQPIHMYSINTIIEPQHTIVPRLIVVIEGNKYHQTKMMRHQMNICGKILTSSWMTDNNMKQYKNFNGDLTCLTREQLENIMTKSLHLKSHVWHSKRLAFFIMCSYVICSLLKATCLMNNHGYGMEENLRLLDARGLWLDYMTTH